MPAARPGLNCSCFAAPPVTGGVRYFSCAFPVNVPSAAFPLMRLFP